MQVCSQHLASLKPWAVAVAAAAGTPRAQSWVSEDHLSLRKGFSEGKCQMAGPWQQKMSWKYLSLPERNSSKDGTHQRDAEIWDNFSIQTE